MPSPSSPAQLQREWVLCAIAAAAARFIPLPLADDLVKDRATRTAVARIWRARGLEPDPQVVAVLAGGSAGALGSLRRGLRRLPLTLVLFPFRKLRLWVTAVQGVSGDLLEVLLLARAVDRCLESGWFATSDRRELLEQARVVRQAHDRAVQGADLRALQVAVGSAFQQVGDLSRQARTFARERFGRRADLATEAAPVTAEVPAAQATSGDVAAAGDRGGGDAQAAALRTGAEKVEAALARPESARLLTELDARFVAALAALSPGIPVRPANGGGAVTPPSAAGG